MWGKEKIFIQTFFTRGEDRDRWPSQLTGNHLFIVFSLFIHFSVIFCPFLIFLFTWREDRNHNDPVYKFAIVPEVSTAYLDSERQFFCHKLYVTSFTYDEHSTLKVSSQYYCSTCHLSIRRKKSGVQMHFGPSVNGQGKKTVNSKPDIKNRDFSSKLM